MSIRRMQVQAFMSIDFSTMIGERFTDASERQQYSHELCVEEDKQSAFFFFQNLKFFKTELK